VSERAGPRLACVVIGVEGLEAAARAFADALELSGAARPDGAAHRIPIGESALELSSSARPLGLASLELASSDLAATAQRLAARGVSFERTADGALRLAGAATHGVAILIRGPRA
jgi:hypothetical protein